MSLPYVTSLLMHYYSSHGFSSIHVDFFLCLWLIPPTVVKGLEENDKNYEEKSRNQFIGKIW